MSLHNLLFHNGIQRSIAVAAPFKAWDCDRSLAGIAGSNPAGAMDVCLLWVLCVVGRGLCFGLIMRPVESYRLRCVWVWSRRPVSGVHDPESGRDATRQEGGGRMFHKMSAELHDNIINL